MPHTPSAAKKISTFLKMVGRDSLEQLAQSYLIFGEELLEAEDTADAMAQRACLAVVDAVGKLRFPNEWIEARDNAGANQAVG